MKLTEIIHTNVLPDGTFSDKAGAVETKGVIRMSADDGGCGLQNCNCSQGHWLFVALPRTEDGIVRGIRVSFDHQYEMDTFLSEGELFATK